MYKPLASHVHLVYKMRMTLEAWMKMHGKSDVWVAAQVNVDRVTINRIRRRDKTPSLALAGKLKALTKGEVTADDFLVVKRAAPAKETRAARC
jgi:DNA-binding XRE family transcriptional regulator